MEQLAISEYKDIRVLTSQQLADSYETDSDTISKNFNNNKERYTEGKHYILLQGNDLKDAKANGKIYGLPANANKFYLWTEKGAFLHAKSLNTDKAWEVYDRLVDTYFKKFHLLDGISDEMKVLISHDKKLQIVIDHMSRTDNRVENLENTMNIDYGQQLVLTNKIKAVVIYHLGGQDSNAYKEIGKKVFAECSRDYKKYFNVNARANTPRIKFDEAVSYIENWEPCSNTKLEIRNCNAQMNIA